MGHSQPFTVKEYVQASKFDQFNIPANDGKNFITLYLPREFVNPWQKQGNTHLHFGAVRLALTFHGRKGLPAVSRMALLDFRFLEYQHEVIGTVQTTLNAGTVFATLFPNFNTPLKDPHLCDALKVQVQITRASQVQDTYAATLHYQLAYRLQNYAFDMVVPKMAQTDDALLIQVDLGLTLICTFVPRQLTRNQMISLFPESWITKYESLHQVVQPIQSNNPLFIMKESGEVET